MKTFMKTTRRRDTRRMRRIAAKPPVRAPKRVARDMVAHAAALEILG